MTTARQTTRDASDVEEGADGRLFVVCNCGAKAYLGPWGAAHVGTYELSATCVGCGGSIMISRAT